MSQEKSTAENRETVTQVQIFTASSIYFLTILRDVCTKKTNTECTEKELYALNRFINTSNEFIKQIKSNNDDEEFDYSRFVKKAFDTLKVKEHCEYLKNKDGMLFEVRDENNKIMTIIPGIDIKLGYKLLDEKERDVFWQHMYLFASSVFTLIKIYNNDSFGRKYAYVGDLLEYIKNDISKTGVLCKTGIFNPFIGITTKGGTYGINDMSTHGELPAQQNVSIESLLSVMGVEKILDQDKLNSMFKDIKDEQVAVALDQVVGLLGANNDPEIKEVCGLLVKDIVSNIKENGFTNLGEMFQKLTENAKKNIDQKKLMKTAVGVKSFMANSEEKMKEMTNEKGEPVGEQLLSMMSVPLKMMNFMGMGIPENNEENK